MYNAPVCFMNFLPVHTAVHIPLEFEGAWMSLAMVSEYHDECSIHRLLDILCQAIVLGATSSQSHPLHDELLLLLFLLHSDIQHSPASMISDISYGLETVSHACSTTSILESSMLSANRSGQGYPKWMSRSLWKGTQTPTARSWGSQWGFDCSWSLSYTLLLKVSEYEGLWLLFKLFSQFCSCSLCSWELDFLFFMFATCCQIWNLFSLSSVHLSILFWLT